MVKIGRSLLEIFIPSLLFFSFSSPAYAEVKLEAVVDRNQLNAGDALTLTVSVSSDEAVNVAEPRLPSLDGFQLINTWSGTEARSTFSNGKFETVRTRKFNFQLATPQKGKLKIGPVEVVVNGITYKTQPIKIEVLAGGAPPPNQPTDPFANDPFNQQMADVDDLFNQLLGRSQGQRGQRPGPQGQRGQRGAQPNISGDVSIQVQIDKKKVYAGEQITATWYLYTSGQIRDIDTLKYPSLNGFWKEDIEIATHLNFEREVVNGVVMRRALLASYALFPVKPGKTEIDPYEAKITSITSGGIIGFGLGRPETKVTKSRKIPIEVLPLPDNKPANFVGAVGDFNLTAQLDTQTVTVNQPFTLKIRFDGSGNAKLIDQPKLEFPGQVELYDTKADSKFFKDGRSYKEFEVLLIPRRTGMIEIPGLSVSVFDPVKGEYAEKTTDPLRVMVQPGKGDEMIPSSPVVAEVSEPVKKDTMPSEILVWSAGKQFAFLDRASFWGGVALALCFALFMKARREFGWGQKLKSLSNLAQKRFAKVKDLASKGQWRQVGVETTNAVYFILGEISGEGGANVELQKLIMKAPPSVRRDLGETIEKLMDTLQILSFAPEEVVGRLKDKDRLSSLVSEAEKVMGQAIALGVNSEAEGIGEDSGQS